MIARSIGPVVVGVIVVALWAAVASLTQIPDSSLPGPEAVLAALRDDRALLLSAAWVTATEVILGLGLALGVGVTCALAMHRARWLADGLYPWLVVSQLVPIIAVAPIFVIWLGLGLESKVLLVALVSFFPVAVNALDGLRSTDPELVRVLRTLGASRRALLHTAQWPAALPMLFTGCKVASALAVIGAVFAEWSGSSDGLGYLILTYNAQLDTAEMFAAVAVLSALGLALFGAIVLVERRVVSWSGR